MPTENGIQPRKTQSEPCGWVRLEHVRKSRGNLNLYFSIHEEKRGRKKIDSWRITCRGVREAQITDFNGGGLALYSTNHPAARQHTARQAHLQWINGDNEAVVLGVLYRTHTEIVDDWIPFDSYVPMEILSSKKCICRGPNFLLGAYSRALQANGINTQLKLLKLRRAERKRLRVLHFGSSFVVAAGFRISSEASLRE
jgi:hypothetical protein